MKCNVAGPLKKRSPWGEILISTRPRVVQGALRSRWTEVVGELVVVVDVTSNIIHYFPEKGRGDEAYESGVGKINDRRHENAQLRLGLELRRKVRERHASSIGSSRVAVRKRSKLNESSSPGSVGGAGGGGGGGGGGRGGGAASAKNSPPFGRRVESVL